MKIRAATPESLSEKHVMLARVWIFLLFLGEIEENLLKKQKKTQEQIKTSRST